jgi:hypothetical protein
MRMVRMNLSVRFGEQEKDEEEQVGHASSENKP